MSEGRMRVGKGRTRRDEQVQAGLTAALFRLAHLGRITPFMIMAILTVYYHERSGLTGPLIAASMLATGTLYILLQRRDFLSRPQSLASAAGWRRRFAIGSAMTGTAWAIACGVWFDPNDLGNQALLGLTLLSVATGSAVARSPDPLSAGIHVSLVTVPILVLWATAPTGGSVGLAFCGLLYLTWLANGVWVLHEDHISNIRLRLDHAGLIAHLSDARAAEAEARIAAEQARSAAELARDAAEAGNRSKSEFLATVSHELRTPLHGILGMASILNEAPLEPAHRQALETLKDAGEALSVIIDDVLALSSLEAGRTKLEPQTVQLDKLIDSVLRLLRTRAWDKDITLEASLAKDVPLKFEGDPGRLRQILLNLVGNAIKFTERGGVTVRAECDAGSANRIKITVEDTGIGIPEEALGKLFQPFTQVDQSHSRRHGGAGLGLSICKRLVELMGGTIGVSTSLGLGSSFWFSLPIRAGSGSAAATITTTEAPSQALSILGIDDNAHARRVLEAILTAAGHPVTTLASTEEALRKIESTTFDAILLDYELPGLKGADAIAAIAQKAPGVPILLMSGHEREQPDVKALASLVAGHLVKPFTPSQLLDALRRVTAPSFPAAAFALPLQHLDADLATLRSWVPAMGAEAVSQIVTAYLDSAEKFASTLGSGSAVPIQEQEAAAKEWLSISESLGLTGLTGAAAALCNGYRMATSETGVEAARKALEAEAARIRPALEQLAKRA